MSSCDASRSGRGEPLHTRRTVNDSTTRSAFGTDRKERIQQWLPEAQSEGSGDSAHGVLHPGTGCSALCWSKRPLRLGRVVQALAEIYHILEEEGMFLSDAAKTRLPELARQFHLLYSRLSREALAEVRGQRVEGVTEDAFVIHLIEWQVTEIGLNPRG